MDLVLLKVLNLSFELKPIPPLFGLKTRLSGNDQPIDHARMILVNDLILRLMVGATLTYESSLKIVVVTVGFLDRIY